MTAELREFLKNLGELLRGNARTRVPHFDTHRIAAAAVWTMLGLLPMPILLLGLLFGAWLLVRNTVFGKAIYAIGEGVQLLSSLGVGSDPKSAPPGVVVAATPVTNLGDATAALQIAQDFVAAIGKHRHWDRSVDGVPA